MDYDKNGWPVATTRAVTSPPTKEELLLGEALVLIGELEAFLKTWTFSGTAKVLRVRAAIEEVNEVVSDYAHLHAQVEELEAEVDDRDEKIAALEERVVELEEELHAEDE